MLITLQHSPPRGPGCRAEVTNNLPFLVTSLLGKLKLKWSVLAIIASHGSLHNIMRRRWSRGGCLEMTRRGPAPCQASSSVPSVSEICGNWTIIIMTDQSRGQKWENYVEPEQCAMAMEAWDAVTWNMWGCDTSSKFHFSSDPSRGTRGRGEETGGWGCLVSVKCKQGGETERERPQWGRKLIRCSNIIRAVNEVSWYYHT